MIVKSKRKKSTCYRCGLKTDDVVYSLFDGKLWCDDCLDYIIRIANNYKDYNQGL